jgi:macrolide transport system ATP-binding/permease protein
MRWWQIRKRDQDVEREIQSDLDLEEEEQRERGVSAEEARHAAMRAFGNTTLISEQTRSVWSWNELENLLRDLRIGVRTLFRSPGFSVLAVLVMALCLGATTALFSVVRGVLLEPLPFRDPTRLVMVYERFRGSSSGSEYDQVSPADYYDWRSRTRGFEDIAALRDWQFNLSGGNGEMPEVVHAEAGTWNLFSVLGVRPALGRTFTENEDQAGASRVAMLTWSLYERRFGGDPGVLGKEIHMDGNSWTVVGVLPRWFAYPDANVQLWVPYTAIAAPGFLQHHQDRQSLVVARMRPEVSLAAAMSEVKAVQYHLHMEHLDEPVAGDVISRPMLDDLVQDVKEPLLVLLGAVGCMLLIGCLNVANLLVARGASRQKEIAIRGALGAGRLTLIRQHLVESVLLCGAGGVLGVLLSVVVMRWLIHAWRNLPRAAAIHMDGGVVAFACGLVIATGLLAGLLPAMLAAQRSTFARLAEATRTVRGSASRSGLRRTLLTVEIAVTVVLLVAGGLLFKSFLLLRLTDVGAATDNVLTLHYDLPQFLYDTPAKVVTFSDALLERVRHLPGVAAVGLGSVVPGAGYGDDDVFTIAEHPPGNPGQAMPHALTRVADPGYFHALEIPLLRGRVFMPQDRLKRANIVVISQQLAHEYFPGQDPLGMHIKVPDWGNDTSYEVVGVVGDTLYQAGKASKATIYVPVLAGQLDRDYTLVMRTSSNPLAISLPAQKEIAALDPGLPVSNVLTMQQVLGQSVETASFSATLVLAFGALSLVLAAVGMFGVLSYMTTQRTGEIGVRMALGAERGQVVRLLLGDGLRPALYGLALGILVSAGAVQMIQSMLYGTRPLDPAVFAAVAVLLLVVAALSCLVPALRASAIDPMQALRSE